MIAKVSTSSSAKVAIDYANDQKKGAEIVSQHMLLSTDVGKFHQDFSIIQKLNTSCKKNVISVILSLSVDNKEKVTKKDWKQVIADFSKSMNLDQHQHVALLHKNKANRHVHLYYNRINFDGKAYNDSMIGKKAGDVAHEISIKYDWISAKVVSKCKKQESLPIRNVIYQNHQAIIERPNSSTLEKYIDNFKSKDVNVKIVMGKNGKVNGLRFETQKTSFKASEVHREMSFNKTIRKIYPQLNLKQLNEELPSILENKIDEMSQVQLSNEIDRALQQILGHTMINELEVEDRKTKNRQEQLTITKKPSTNVDGQKVIFDKEKSFLNGFLKINNINSLSQLVMVLRSQDVKIKVSGFNWQKATSSRVKPYIRLTSEKANEKVDLFKLLKDIYPMAATNTINKVVEELRINRLVSLNEFVKSIDLGLKEETVSNGITTSKSNDSSNKKTYQAGLKASDGYKSKSDARSSKTNLENNSNNYYQSESANKQRQKLSSKEYISKLHRQIISNPDITTLKKYINEFVKHGVVVEFERGKNMDDVNASFSFKDHTMIAKNIQLNEDFNSLMQNSVSNDFKNLSSTIPTNEPNLEVPIPSQNIDINRKEDLLNEEMQESVPSFYPSSFVASKHVDDPGDPDHSYSKKKKKKKNKGFKR